ncbi:sodium:proton antiporter [Deltaproteobacteria bacterium]|nr:sodium:proton antiporter [Deltaproteobacteria bacterium]
MTFAHPIALLLAQIGCILLVSRAFGIAFRYLGQPLVVAEIVAGIALGPSLAGRLFPDASAALFPASGMAALGGVSQLGLVLFMFLVGLELDLEVVRKRGRLASAVSLSSIALPFLMGLGLGYALWADFAPEGVGLWPFALFIGASMCVTAFPVLARILRERGMLDTPLGALALTCAAINDVAAWCLLAFVIAAVGAHGLLDAITTTALALGFVAVMLGVVRPFLARVQARFGTVDDLSHTAVAVIFLFLLGSALTAELIGIHALFGAFLFGAAVPRKGPAIHALPARLNDVVIVLLLPLFFAFTGLKTEIGLLDSPELWGWCGAVSGVAIVGKLAGAAIPGRLGGLSLRESAALGVLMNTRGLMELVILAIGLELGVLTPTLFAMLVLMAVATTFITSPVVRLLYPPRRLLAERAAVESTTSVFGLLVCISHPDSAAGLGRISAAMMGAGPARGWALRLISVDDDPSLFPVGDAPPDEQEDPSQTLARAAAEAGGTLEPLALTSSDRTGDIVHLAALKQAGAILLGIHRPLVGEARLGGPLLTIASRAKTDVCMFRDNGLRQVRRVLLALGSVHDEAARRVAERIASSPGVELAVLDGRRDAGRVEALLAASRGYDLVVVGVGAEWDLPMYVFDLRAPRLLTELGASLLIVHGAAVSTPS